MFFANTRDALWMVGVGVFTAWALATDLRRRKIPNVLTVPSLALAIAFHACFDGWEGLKCALAGFGLGFGTLLVLWLVGGGGAGDVKLMGALGAWLGWRLTLYVLIGSTAIVAVGSVALLLIEGILQAWGVAHGQAAGESGVSGSNGRGKAASIEKWRERRRIMPYALPVGLATWLIMVWQFIR
jgi:prepilin peptidase CpaA